MRIRATFPADKIDRIAIIGNGCLGLFPLSGGYQESIRVDISEDDG